MLRQRVVDYCYVVGLSVQKEFECGQLNLIEFGNRHLGGLIVSDLTSFLRVRQANEIWLYRSLLTNLAADSMNAGSTQRVGLRWKAWRPANSPKVFRMYAVIF